MIIANGISVSYGSKRALLGIDLELKTSAIHGVVGLNGSGKTTLLNALFGLKRMDSGSVLYNGSRISKKGMAYLPTENFFYAGITGREYLRLFNNSRFDDNQWQELFAISLDSLIDSYSTGMKKKLALLGVLKQNKPIIILDEPFNGLDIESCRVVRSILLKLKEKGRTILVTSHIFETLANLCDSISYLTDGMIEETVSTDDFGKLQAKLYEDIECRSEAILSKLVEGL